jgi:hypothetical protein
LGAFVCPFVIADNSPRSIGVIMLFVHLFTAICVGQLPETSGKAMGATSIDDDRDSHGVVVYEDLDEEESDAMDLALPEVS